jgi:aspartate/methionine/tyrosine aminotransferase
MKRFNEMRGVECSDPKGALYAFPRIPGIGEMWMTDTDFLLDLLKEEGVIFDPGSSYGALGQSHVRTLTMPKIETLEIVYNKLERFLEKKGAA